MLLFSTSTIFSGFTLRSASHLSISKPQAWWGLLLFIGFEAGVSDMAPRPDLTCGATLSRSQQNPLTCISLFPYLKLSHGFNNQQPCCSASHTWFLSAGFSDLHGFSWKIWDTSSSFSWHHSHSTALDIRTFLPLTGFHKILMSPDVPFLHRPLLKLHLVFSTAWFEIQHLYI